MDHGQSSRTSRAALVISREGGGSNPQSLVRLGIILDLAQEDHSRSLKPEMGRRYLIMHLMANATQECRAKAAEKKMR
jgi:hypothetical protein